MSKQGYSGPLEQIDQCCWRIPKDYKIGMRVEGRIFADDRLIEQIRDDQAPEQVANVAFLPGIQMASLAMPDIHWGYGFCIGGVSATDPAEGGVVSPGGVGYDINCGVRLMRTNLNFDDVQPRLEGPDGSLVSRHSRRRGHGRTIPVRWQVNSAACWPKGRPIWPNAAGPRPATSNTPRPAAVCLAPSRIASASERNSAAATSAARSAPATTFSKFK